MSDTAMPCFVQFPNVGNLVGRILAGYGELEVEMALCVAETMNGNVDDALRLLFVRMSAEKRHDMAKKAMRVPCTSAGMDAEFTETMVDMTWCRNLRNQYAHCQWYWTEVEGVCFINLEEIAKKPGAIGPLADHRLAINEVLLGQQDAYFHYVRASFWHLAEALKRHRTSADKLRNRGPIFPKPSKVTRPVTHL